MELPTDIIAIDTETSGLPPQDQRGNPDYSLVSVLSIGWATSDNKDGQIFIRHEPSPEITPEAQHLHGITPQMLESGVSPAQAVEEVGNLLDRYTIICGHNLMGFDLPVLCELGVAPGARALLIDTLLVWKAYNLGMRLPAGERLEFFYGRVHQRKESLLCNLAHVLKVFGIVNPGAHGAQADAAATLLLFEALYAAGIIKRVLGL